MCTPMSTQEVLDTFVRLIIENSQFLTAEHKEAIDTLFIKMAITLPALKSVPTLPPSPKEEHVNTLVVPVSQSNAEASPLVAPGLPPPRLPPLSTPGLSGLPPPLRKYRPPYNDYRWPSPLPKVFVQHIRGRNAWDNCKYWRRYGGVWSADFKAVWLLAGNTEFRLTHDNCLRYLAYRCNCSVDEFMNKKPADVNAKFFNAYSGIPGHYIRRYHF